MFKKVQLQLRLTLVCAASTGLVLAGMAVASYHYAAGHLERQWAEAFSRDLSNIFFYLRSQDTLEHSYLMQMEATNAFYIRIESKGRPIFFTQLDKDRAYLTESVGRVAKEVYKLDYRSPPSGSGLQPDMAVFSFTHPGERIVTIFGLSVKAGIKYRAAVATVPMGNGNYMGVVVVKDRSGEAVRLGQLGATYFACVVIALLCLSVFAWYFSGWSIKPVEASYRQQAEFVAAVSHELRRPLAVMRASSGAIHGASLGEAARFADKIDIECERLAALTEDLLCLTAADSGRLSLRCSEVDPVTLVLSAAERYEPIAAKKAMRMGVELPEEVLPAISCDADRIEQLLGILLDNAVSYTPEGGLVRLSVDCERNSVRFYVADNGPGVPRDKREKIFERFYRGDAARTDKEHYGLGLSVGREIAALHKGSIYVRDAAEGGAEFVVTLPR